MVQAVGGFEHPRYLLDKISATVYISDGPWEVEYTDQFEGWWDSLTAGERRPVIAAIDLLAEDGPNLGRPAVDTLTASRHPNMKELRAGTIRVLFAFDPRRCAILLIGGDKRGRWQEFYDRMIPIADDLYDEHLVEIANEEPNAP